MQIMLRITLFCVVLASFGLCSSSASCSSGPSSASSFSSSSAILPPLSSSGGSIIDSSGKRVHIHGVNWYGFDQEFYVAGGLQYQSLEYLIKNLVSFGFNAVRIPFSNDLLARNPTVISSNLLHNFPLIGMTGMEILDVVIQNITAHGLLVLLDNHISTAEWCCNGDDGNGLWWTEDYSEEDWLAQWTTLVTKYANNPYVFGLDLRNEPRSTVINGKSYSAQWGTGGNTQDWRAAATRAANALLKINPNLLILVEGINYSNDLQDIGALPIKLDSSALQSQIIYAPHTYSWQQSFSTCDDLYKFWDIHWNYLSINYSYPLIITEFGSCNNEVNCVNDTAPNSGGLFFQCFTNYVNKYGLSWLSWTYNGMGTEGRVETFGVVDPIFSQASDILLPALQNIMLQF